jgi:hypothetical protein
MLIVLGTLPFANIVDMLPLLNELPMLLKPWERRARAYFKSDMQFIKAKKEVRPIAVPVGRVLICFSKLWQIMGSFIPKNHCYVVF